eukprot:jgi/Mesen1/5041/ME000025S04438
MVTSVPLRDPSWLLSGLRNLESRKHDSCTSAGLSHLLAGKRSGLFVFSQVKHDNNPQNRCVSLHQALKCRRVFCEHAGLKTSPSFSSDVFINWPWSPNFITTHHAGRSIGRGNSQIHSSKRGMEQLDAASWDNSKKVLLYWPNIIDYVRILIVLAAFTMAGPERPTMFAGLYIVCFALDAVDGIVARAFKQVSAFGAFLDVALDCLVRAMTWAAAVPGPWAAVVPCVEWAVFVATHAQGGAAWKTGCFVGAPPWVAAVMAHNFRSPPGVAAIAGLHFLPLWLWLRRYAPGFWLSSRWIGAFLVFGRACCLAVELWMLARHLGSILESDWRAKEERRQQQASSSN